MGAPSVSFAQMAAPSPRISASPRGLTTVVKYRVAWADAFTFVNEILGILDGNPWIWPASPNMRAYDADIEPSGLRSDVASQSKPASYGSSPGEYYKYGIISVTFGSQASLAVMPFTDVEGGPPADQFDPANPVPMSSHQVNYATEMIKIPGGGIKWATTKADSSAQTIPAGVANPESGSTYYRIPTFDLNMTLHNCLGVDYSVVRNKIGCINSAVTFTNCERETLLLDGLSTSRREMSDGVAIVDVTLKYKWRSIGWNVAMGSNGEFYRYIVQGGFLLYGAVDISPLAVITPDKRWQPYGINGLPGRG